MFRNSIALVTLMFSFCLLLVNSNASHADISVGGTAVLGTTSVADASFQTGYLFSNRIVSPANVFTFNTADGSISGLYSPSLYTPLYPDADGCVRGELFGYGFSLPGTTAMTYLNVTYRLTPATGPVKAIDIVAVSFFPTSYSKNGKPQYTTWRWHKNVMSGSIVVTR